MGTHVILAVALSVATASSFGAALKWAVPSGDAAEPSAVGPGPARDNLPEVTFATPPLLPTEPLVAQTRRVGARPDAQAVQQTPVLPREEQICTGWEPLMQGPVRQRARTCAPAEEEARTVEAPPRHLSMRELPEAVPRADVPAHPRIVIIVEPPE